MVTDKQLSQENFDKMEANGQIAKPKGSSERVIRTDSNTWVTPQFYFQGLNKAKRSKKMIELKDKVNQLVSKYTVAKSETDKVAK